MIFENIFGNRSDSKNSEYLEYFISNHLFSRFNDIRIGKSFENGWSECEKCEDLEKLNFRLSQSFFSFK